MKRYELNSLCMNCRGFLENKVHEVVKGKWVKYSDHKAELKKAVKEEREAIIEVGTDLIRKRFLNINSDQTEILLVFAEAIRARGNE